jgi:hypothetical protein
MYAQKIHRVLEYVLAASRMWIRPIARTMTAPRRRAVFALIATGSSDVRSRGSPRGGATAPLLFDVADMSISYVA